MPATLDLQWQDDIMASYPYQFPEHFSFECLGGWATILREMCRRVDVVLEPEDKAYFKWGQVKEKYGTLRAYNNGPDVVEEIVDWAEEVSGMTCEVCGRPGHVKGAGWYAARCEECI